MYNGANSAAEIQLAAEIQSVLEIWDVWIESVHDLSNNIVSTWIIDTLNLWALKSLFV